MSDEAELPEALATVEFTKNFLRVGHFTWNEWVAMDDESRAVVIQAGNELEGERAALIAMAITTEDGAARALSLSDGGDTLVSNALARAVARSARSTQP
jgi:hypothetical protein